MPDKIKTRKNTVMSTKSKNVASTKENTASAITEGVIAQAEKITDFSALVIERVKGLKTFLALKHSTS